MWIGIYMLIRWSGIYILISTVDQLIICFFQKYFMDTLMHCFVFFTLNLSVKNNILVKPCTRNWYFSVICQLETWNNVGLSDALLIMELDVPDPVHLY